MVRKSCTRNPTEHRAGLKTIGLWLALTLLVGQSTVLADLGSAGTWVIECVDCPKYIGPISDRSLRLDYDSRPHIAYGGDHLYYARHDGTTWLLETADTSSGVGFGASLDIDSSGHPHISYPDYPNDVLKHAYKNGEGWHIDIVDAGLGSEGGDSSLALGVDGYPHISYFITYDDDNYGDLKYAYKDASGWHVETVSSGGWIGQHNSLILDSAGIPHLTYWNGSDLKYAYRYASERWHIETVDSPGSVGLYTSLAMDSSGRPHVSYHDWTNNTVKYAVLDTSEWHIEVVDSVGRGVGSSIALDGAGQPCITYYDSANQCLKYASREAAGWRTQIIDATDSVGRYSSLALDKDGYPHVSYSGADLQYAHQDTSGWSIATVDHGIAAGSNNSLALDADDYPHISYRASGLKYAYVDSDGWHTESVDGEQSTRDISFALDDEGNAHVSYYEEGSGDVRYAFQDVQGWQVETVDTEGGVGRQTSLALDGAGYPHVGYAGGADYEVKYAYRDDSGWHPEVLDPDGTPSSISLAVDEYDNPHLSWCYWVEVDIECQGLVYHYRDSSGWHGEVVDSEGETGYGSSLALDRSGHPHVSYYDGTNEDLKYAHKDASGWHIETIDSEGDVGWVSSLELDEAGFAHISYYDNTHGDLRYAYKDASGWHIETVDSLGFVGSRSSLALDARGRPHISYYDGSNRDLKYAVRSYWLYLPTLQRGS